MNLTGQFASNGATSKEKNFFCVLIIIVGRNMYSTFVVWDQW